MQVKENKRLARHIAVSSCRLNAKRRIMKFPLPTPHMGKDCSTTVSAGFGNCL
jgi:hypothetical protein